MTEQGLQEVLYTRDDAELQLHLHIFYFQEKQGTVFTLVDSTNRENIGMM